MELGLGFLETRGKRIYLLSPNVEAAAAGGYALLDVTCLHEFPPLDYFDEQARGVAVYLQGTPARSRPRDSRHTRRVARS